MDRKERSGQIEKLHDAYLATYTLPEDATDEALFAASERRGEIAQDLSRSPAQSAKDAELKLAVLRHIIQTESLWGDGRELAILDSVHDDITSLKSNSDQ